MAKMLEARILLETHAVRNIIRLNNVSVTEEMAALTDEMFSTNTGASNKKILDFTHLDHQFHHAIMNAGGNPFLFEAYKGMHCHLHIGRFYHVKGEIDQKDAPSEHMEIIEAIRTRDVYRAEIAISSHIQDSIDRYNTWKLLRIIFFGYKSSYGFDHISFHMDARNMQVGVNRHSPLKCLKKVTEKHVKDLCTKKKASVIKGMKPKAKEKKPFDAFLVLKDDGSIGFAFSKKTFAKSK
ncbi:FCD domain-containing protein [Peribacillus sp. SIMBA_075]|uniref:FCD domain-containing protein n=1 Tax=Peribacillus sp. SIMBA_075 TaxID=3085813 RepID=UPI003979CFF5